MASQSTIEWTDMTWNPVAGCSIESAGCTNCYAMRMAARLQSMNMPKYKGLTRKSGGRAKWTGKVRTDEKSLQQPLAWKKPRKVFVNSMSDLFHPDVPFKFVHRVWDIMEKTPQHQYQILTKRPQIMARFMKERAIVLPNVWLGTSVEDDRVIDRIDRLRGIPAAVRFISFEPLIGSVGEISLDGIHWAIVGGESGPKSRPIDEQWVEEILDQCLLSKTKFFFKQWGGPNKKAAGRTLNNRTYDEMPENTC